MKKVYVGREANVTSEQVDQIIATIPAAPRLNLASMARNLYSGLQPIGSESPSALYPDGVTYYHRSIHVHMTEMHLTREDAQRLLDAINAAR